MNNCNSGLLSGRMCLDVRHPLQTMFILVGVVVIGASPVWANSDSRCRAEGEPVQWIADYCMSMMETDDEIAVSDCIEKERKRSFTTACASKLHFKKQLCELVVRRGTRAGTIEQCVSDPGFKGRVVEKRGAGA